MDVVAVFKRLLGLRNQSQGLILTRKYRQDILIGDDILVTILGKSHGGIAVSIVAPQSVRVLRGEIIDRKMAEIVSASDQDLSGVDVLFDDLENSAPSMKTDEQSMDRMVASAVNSTH